MSVRSDLDQIRDRYALQRRKAIARFRARPKPEHLLRRLSTYTDHCLGDLYALLPLPKHCALVAVGGYGRQELYPFSDVDVLLLLAQPPSSQDTLEIEGFIAALWDSGLKVATSVRTIDQCIEVAEADIATQTAQLEARFIAGYEALFNELQSTLAEQLDIKNFYEAKLAEMRQRHAHYQNTPYALEPNCKESPGALRDLQVLLWLAKAMNLGQTWREIAQSDLLSHAEVRALQQATQAFMRLRIELHLLTGRAEDRLLFEYQPALATIYGFTQLNAQRASEKLMQRYYWAARLVHQMNMILMQGLEELLFSASPTHITELDDDFLIRNQRLHLRAAERLPQDPTLILRCFTLLQHDPTIQSLSAYTLRALWHHRKLIDQKFRLNPVNQSAFLAILQAPRAVLQSLRLMNLLGLLPRYIPEFRHIVGQMQHDLFHVYTVDQHTLMVVRNLRRFNLAEYTDEHPLASELMAQFERPWVLYIAALFHDIAKGRGGNHSELGAHDARAFCQRHRLTNEDTELICFLVQEHLSMSTVAQKRDISDPVVVQTFTEHVQNLRRLQALYLLTVADIKGTNPVIWNSWKAKLLLQLYEQSRAALQGHHPGTSEVLAQRKAQALSALLGQGISETAVQALWDVLDISYFLRHECDEIIWHGQALHSALLYPEPVIKLRTVGAGETVQLMIYTPDRDDLFMHICAFFDQHQLSVQDARIYTTLHGWALDSFILLLPSYTHYSDQWAQSIQHALSWHLQHASDATPANESIYVQAQSRRARVFPIPATVDIQAMSEADKWRISIVCADRRGLLYSIAQVFTAERIRLKSAKIMTLGERVEDTFIVHSEDLHHSIFHKHLERTLRAAL
ncbi:[protein-PII] uridylyltransferase [Paenalcaligenes hominis]|uniref:Bifunctional uridylyltransferase/uridylyl-removing enzyme n=1 Tax=Paenalcaligenes hominis TaxID=643674 RepID=A0ABX0WNU6_9BURK|nr:[protein-PII] uridylyltransferase [Paenalcaligenes hominis]NJB64459.1 [protein-PII] uridylyltransferase [Paenalcaligenes hominis]GGE67480.1 bifunctional uridylyltransferase/uridylyl-removing enzyme [Paenalcaligenes hominis]